MFFSSSAVSLLAPAQLQHQSELRRCSPSFPTSTLSPSFIHIAHDGNDGDDGHTRRSECFLVPFSLTKDDLYVFQSATEAVDPFLFTLIPSPALRFLRFHKAYCIW